MNRNVLPLSNEKWRQLQFIVNIKSSKEEKKKRFAFSTLHNKSLYARTISLK
jgi:hypothetical protein